MLVLDAPEAQYDAAEAWQSRQEADYEVGVDNDQRRLAMVIRGGGMTAVHNAGAVEWLDSNRSTPDGKSALDVTDVVFADSAGAIIAAAALSGQAELTARVFYGNLPHQEFIGHSNFIRRRRPIFVNLELLRENLEDVFDLDALFDNPTELVFPVSNLKSMKSEFYSTKDGSLTKDNFLDTVMQGMHLPVVAGGPKDHKADGGLLQICGEKTAADMGVTDVLSFANSPYKENEGLNHKIMNLVGVWAQLYGGAHRLGGIRAYRKFCREQQDFLPKLYNGEFTDETGVNLTVKHPEPSPEIATEWPGMMERNPRKLRLAYEVGKNTGRLAFGHDPIDFPQEAIGPTRLETLADKATEAYETAVEKAALKQPDVA